MSEYMIKAYVKKEVKQYIEEIALYHNISISKLITMALNQPSIYQMMVKEFEDTIAEKSL